MWNNNIRNKILYNLNINSNYYYDYFPENNRFVYEYRWEFIKKNNLSTF
jgi:hypothetical protein